MQHTRLGRTALEVSRIGFGCAAIGGWDYGPTDDATSVRAVRAALEAGVTLFDTADVYGLGHAEEVLARALGGERHRVTVATKCGVRWDASGRTARDLSPRYVETAVRSSLRRLRVTSIRLLQLHWPDRSVPIGETMEALARLQRDGLVEHVGCCNFPSELVDEAQRYGRLESCQVPLSLLEREWSQSACQSATRHGMSILTYNTLAQGILSGKFTSGATFGPSDLRSRSRLFRRERDARNARVVRALRNRAFASGRTCAQEAIRWVLDRPGVSVALVGARTPEQAVENAGAATGASTGNRSSISDRVISA